MKCFSRVLMLLFFLSLIFPAVAREQPKMVMVELQVSLELGERKVAANQKFKVSSGETATFEIVEGEPVALKISVSPFIDDQERLRMEVTVEASYGEHKFQRSFRYLTYSGASSQLVDRGPNETLNLGVTHTIAP